MKKFLMRNRTWGTRFCRGSSDGCEEGTDMTWRSVPTPSQPLQQMTIPETQELTPIQTGTRARVSELSELAIHTLLVETRARDLDREVYQDPDSDRYLIPGERVFDNAADDLETIAVSKRSMSLLPQKEVVRTDLQTFEQETQPLAKIWCVKMEEDTHQPNELNSQMRVMKTFLKARYRLSDLLRAQRNDRMTSNLKRWIENGSLDKGDLEEDSYRILRQYFMQKEGRLYLNKDWIVACKRRDEDNVLYKYNAIVLPQLYQTELLFRSHDQMGHQGIDKVYQRILKRFEWPGMKKACEKWVTACLSCQQVKDPRKLRFPLQSIESSEFNEVVQIDHQKICMTDSGYNQVLVMIDHITKYAEACGRDVPPPDQYVDSETRLSDDVPIG